MAGSCAPALAADPAALEARLQAMEAEIGRLRAELQAMRSGGTAAGATTAPAASAPVQGGSASAAQLAALEERVARAEAREGFRVGPATFRVGGFLKLWSAYSIYDDGTPAAGALVRDFWLPQQVPVGGPRSTHFGAHLKQTRLWLSGTMTAAGSPLTGYVEVDFQTAPGTQGTARTTNGYNLALRRATISWKGLTAGQDWTTFQNVATLPETTDFVGPTEGTIFVRQPLVRWSGKLAKATGVALAVENPITASITSASPALRETDEAIVPDVVARINQQVGKAELSLAGLVHDVTVNDGIDKDSALGWGVSLAGKVPFGPKGRHDLRFMVTGGEGISHYVGLNFAPDAVFAGGKVHTVGLVSGFGALRLGWTPKLRSTLMGGWQRADYPDLSLPAAANRSAWSVAANLFATPIERLDVGLEYRHGERRLTSGDTGQLDRVEFVTRLNF